MERRAIPDLLDRKYYIPEYQRGYRWEEKQVIDLLDDLNSFFQDGIKGQFYCLQPIVVKQILDKDKAERGLDHNDWYEVIDGQQRLTTLRIIMQVFDQLNRPQFGAYHKHGYTIRYATRPDMQNIFESITVIQNQEGKIVIDQSKNNWKPIIDSHYIYNAASTVLNWFLDDDSTSKLSVFGQFFYKGLNDNLKSVQVVWYETFEDKDPHEIFNRMNSLKVGLSCSELIRSLFLSNTTKFDLGNLDALSQSLKIEVEQERFTQKQVSINEKWDEIEQNFSNKSLQAFLTNRRNVGRNSIELLFDLMSAKYASNVGIKGGKLHKEDELYTYLYFKDLIESSADAWMVWEKVLNAYEKIIRWYGDRDLYHQIGYLNTVASAGHEDDTICYLLDGEFGQKDLKDAVIGMIKHDMKLPYLDKHNDIRIDSLSKLSYDNPTHYKYIKRLLLLYNVETCRIQKNADFFSFAHYLYTEDGKSRVWTLEHIHAQNSDCLPADKKESWIAWIDCNIDTLKNLNLGNLEIKEAQKSIIAELQRDKDYFNADPKKYTYDSVRALFDKVVAFYDRLDESEDKASEVHQLSNMALLDLEQNASIGNSPFETKRQIISNQIADGEYFPICTRKVFLKLYDRSKMQIHSWSHDDRILYYGDMKSKLADYVDNTAF